MWPFRARQRDPDDVRQLRKRVEDLEDEIANVKQRHESLRGSVLTQGRRITRLVEDLVPLEEQDDEDDDPFQEELDRRRHA